MCLRFTACECCAVCMACVTATAADCCECLFPMWSECRDEPKGDCIAKYTDKTVGSDWTSCSAMGYDLSDIEMTIEIKSVTGSADFECYVEVAFGQISQSCDCDAKREEYLPISLATHVTLRNNYQCNLDGHYYPTLVCRSLLKGVDSHIKWNYQLKAALQCCGEKGLEYDANAQNCCCDLWHAGRGDCVVCSLGQKACCADICCCPRCKCFNNQCEYTYF